MTSRRSGILLPRPRGPSSPCQQFILQAHCHGKASKHSALKCQEIHLADDSRSCPWHGFCICVGGKMQHAIFRGLSTAESTMIDELIQNYRNLAWVLTKMSTFFQFILLPCSCLPLLTIQVIVFIHLAFIFFLVHTHEDLYSRTVCYKPKTSALS